MWLLVKKYGVNFMKSYFLQSVGSYYCYLALVSSLCYCSRLIILRHNDVFACI